MTHQTLSLEKYWKLFPATLSHAQGILDDEELLLLLYEEYSPKKS